MNTQIIVDAIAVIITALAFWIWNQYVKPWLTEHHLLQAAQIAVRAAQAVYGRYNGKEKLEHAMKLLQDAGWNIDSTQVITSVQSAWQRLNTQQISAGVKQAQ